MVKQMEQVTEHTYDAENMHYIESCPKCKAQRDLINNPPFSCEVDGED